MASHGARFVWKKNGPKPESTTTTAESTWLVKTCVVTATDLQVSMKAGSRDFGLNATYEENRVSELSLKKKYS